MNTEIVTENTVKPLRQWQDGSAKGFRSGFVSDHTASVVDLSTRRPR